MSLNPRWWLYILSLDGPRATIRQLLFGVFHAFVRETPYAAGPQAGYTSYLRLRFAGCLAFRRTDGALQFFW